ncbi:MAG: hypothetical protein WBF66_07210 [Dehalococcoidia bacterium]
MRIGAIVAALILVLTVLSGQAYASPEVTCSWQLVADKDIYLTATQYTWEQVNLGAGQRIRVEATTDDPGEGVYISIWRLGDVEARVAGPVEGHQVFLDYQAIWPGLFGVLIDNTPAWFATIRVHYKIWVETCQATTAVPTATPMMVATVALGAGCNPVASTFPDGTAIGTIADAISSPGSLVSLWQFEANVWYGYSPQYPEAGDLAQIDRLDVVFICVEAPGSFERPVI